MKKILFIMHMPPPFHGASMVGQRIKEDIKISQSYDCKFINISLARSLDDIGRVSGICKIYRYCLLVINVIVTLLRFRPDACYITPNASGPQFFKDYIIVEISKLLGGKVLIHYHNKGIINYQKRFIYNTFYKSFFKKLDVILLSRLLKYDVEKYVGDDHIYYSKVGIPMILATPRNNTSTTIRFVFLSNLIPSKGVYEILEACMLLQDKKIDFECVFAGGETREISKEKLLSEISKRGLGHCVSYRGRLSEEEKEELLAISDVYLFPTYYHNECFPAAILEAMRAGLCVISTPEGAIKEEVIDGETGLLVKQRSVEELVLAMEYCVMNPQFVKMSGQKGRERFESFYTEEMFMDNMMKIFKKVVG